MSVVAARITENRIELAADSFVLYDGGEKRLNQKKIRQFNLNPVDNLEATDHFYLGTAGSIRDKLAFMDFWNGDKPRNSEYSRGLWKRADVFRLFSDFRQWKKVRNLPNTGKTMKFILACDAGLFYYDDTGELDQFEDYVAIGAGHLVATAFMYKGYSSTKAVKVCIEVVNNVAGDIQTETFQMKNYERS